MKKLLTLITFIICFSSLAQEKTYREDVLTYLNTSGTATQYENAVGGLFDLLEKQYASQNVPDEVWNDLKAETPMEVNRIMNMLVSAYRGTYDQNDIQQMTKFYKSGAGQQLLANRTALTEQQQREVTAFNNTRVGKKIRSSEQEISKKTSEISEIWSRDLYRSTTDRLAEKGFTLQ